MKTRYTVQYWYRDEHDALVSDFDSLKEALKVAANIDTTKYKDILVIGRHYQRINEPVEYNGATYDDWTWELIGDDFIQYYSA